MAKHGHRCVRESELRETSWRMEPEKLVKALKLIIKSGECAKPTLEKKELSIDEAIDSLSQPITGFKRRLLRFILPIARQAVGRREWGKSLAIKSMEICREAVQRLGVMLEERGILPDSDLVYFFSLHELGVLIKRHSPKLIFKALRRRRLLGSLMDRDLGELVKGYPEPVEKVSTPAAGKGASLTGIAIGPGSVEGTARVLKSFNEADQIRAGEILVVPFTDVGWTPYFPLISGLVTEYGGLLSHGAVVAREYGLPCLVACKTATTTIPNGAKVRIDGSTGSISILSLP